MTVYPLNTLTSGNDPIDGFFNGTSQSETLGTPSTNSVYNGGQWADYAVHGLSGNDLVKGGQGDDNLYGDLGNDTIQSFYGYNYINGGSGTDTLDYSWFGKQTTFDVTLGVNADLATGHTFERDIISGFRFDDQFDSIENLKGSSFSDRLYGNSLNNTIDGGYGNDSLQGRSGNDKLFGGQNNDSLSGGNGDDQLFGGSGNDTLVGGLGADDLTGGFGRDTFRFTSVADSTQDLLSQDLITDFSRAEGDRIDLTPLSNTVFEFIGGLSFDGFGPQVRYGFDGGSTVVQVDSNGNGSTDLEITLTGKIALQSTDFIL
jgi:serralysin